MYVGFVTNKMTLLHAFPEHLDIHLPKVVQSKFHNLRYVIGRICQRVIAFLVLSWCFISQLLNSTELSPS